MTATSTPSARTRPSLTTAYASRGTRGMENSVKVSVNEVLAQWGLDLWTVIATGRIPDAFFFSK